MNEAQTITATALVEFGYTPEEDGALVKYKAGRPRERYEPVEGGFLRFTRDDGKWAPVPYTIAEKFAGVSGLLAETHPECFEFVYPAEYLGNIYAEAVQARG